MAGLESLYRFPVFQTPEDYKRLTGMDCPPFDSTRPIKSWFDPNPEGTDLIKETTPASLKVTYKQVISLGPDGSHPAVDSSGNPFFETLQISKSFAKTVNITVKGVGVVDQPVLGELQVPCRPLLANEKMVLGFGGLVNVVDSSSAPTPVGNGGGGGLTARQAAIFELIPAIYKDFVGVDPILPPK